MFKYSLTSVAGNYQAFCSSETSSNYQQFKAYDFSTSAMQHSLAIYLVMIITLVFAGVI